MNYSRIFEVIIGTVVAGVVSYFVIKAIEQTEETPIIVQLPGNNDQ